MGRLIYLLFIAFVLLIITSCAETNATSDNKLPTYAECTIHIPISTNQETKFSNIYHFLKIMNKIISEKNIPMAMYSFNYESFDGLHILLYLNCDNKQYYKDMIVHNLRVRDDYYQDITVGDKEIDVSKYIVPKAYGPEFWSDSDSTLVGSPNYPASLENVESSCRKNVTIYMAQNSDENEQKQLFDSIGNFLFKILYNDLRLSSIFYNIISNRNEKKITLRFGFLDNCSSRDRILIDIITFAKEVKYTDEASYWDYWVNTGFEGYE